MLAMSLNPKLLPKARIPMSSARQERSYKNASPFTIYSKKPHKISCVQRHCSKTGISV